MWFIVKILWTWNLFFTLLEISKPLFFFPFSAMPLSQLLKKNKIIPLFRQWHCRHCLFLFILKALHTQAHSDTQDSVGKLGSGISAMPLPKFKDFLSPPFLILSPAFWLNFGNAIAEIQSLSSIFQLFLNSSYNTN